jgi:hypothetical protein
MALRTAKLNEDAVEPVWGQGFRSARSFTSEPVAPAILSPVLVPTASSTERI